MAKVTIAEATKLIPKNAEIGAPISDTGFFVGRCRFCKKLIAITARSRGLHYLFCKGNGCRSRMVSSGRDGAGFRGLTPRQRVKISA